MTNWKIQAAKDPETSPQILSSLLDSPECHEYLIKNPSTPTGVLATLGVKEAFTSDPMNRRMQVAEVLSNAPTPEIIDRILTWTEGSLNVLQEGEDPDSISYSRTIKHYFYPSAAKNPNTPLKYLEEFAKSEYDLTVSYLAPNPSLPKKFINEFAECLIAASTEREFSRYDRIAENPKLDPKYLKILSRHEKYYIRAAVARNPNTPEDAQVELAADTDSYVFFQLQANQNLCESALLKMCQRTKADVRKSTQWVDDYYNNLKNKALAGNYSKSIQELVVSPDWPI
jgi:hypothetical protein